MLQILRYYMINIKNNSRCRLKINLDEILLKSADLFYRYCKKSVEDSFLMVETPLSARALRARLRAGSDVGQNVERGGRGAVYRRESQTLGKQLVDRRAGQCNVQGVRCDVESWKGECKEKVGRLVINSYPRKRRI